MENSRYAGSPPQGFQPLPNPPAALRAESTAPWLVSFSLFDKQEWFHPNPSTSFNFAYAAERNSRGTSGKFLGQQRGTSGKFHTDSTWFRTWLNKYTQKRRESIFRGRVKQSMDQQLWRLVGHIHISGSSRTVPARNEFKAQMKCISHQTHHLPYLLTWCAVHPAGEFPLGAKNYPLVILHCQLKVINMQKGWSPTVACMKIKINKMYPKIKKAPPCTPGLGIVGVVSFLTGLMKSPVQISSLSQISFACLWSTSINSCHSSVFRFSM